MLAASQSATRSNARSTGSEEGWEVESDKIGRGAVANSLAAAPVLKLYYQRIVLPENKKIQPATGNGRSSTKVVLPENENPASRRRRPFQYHRCTTRKRKIQPAAGDGRSSTKVVLAENENPAGRRRRDAVIRASSESPGTARLD